MVTRNLSRSSFSHSLGQELPLRMVNQGAPEQSFSWALTAASLVKTPNRRIKRRSCHCSRYTPPLHKLRDVRNTMMSNH